LKDTTPKTQLKMTKQYLDLPVAPADIAFGLMTDFEADPHPKKVSMIAGAYRDENGDPWILPSVKEVLSGTLSKKKSSN
jgi:aspartate/tyrosine/aromatic aminotransferase